MRIDRRLVHCAIGALVMTLAALGIVAPALGYKAKIRETSYGIPHVKAHSYGSAGYGVGYAFAEQNICTFANNNVTTSARRSKYFGPDGESPASAAGPVNNLDSDFFWQSVIDSGRIEELLKAKGVQSPSKDAKAAARGYAAGYNAYLKKVGVDGITDPRCRGERWVKPIKAIDVWRRIYQADLLASSQNFISDFVAAEPPTTMTSAPQVSPDEAADALRGSDLDVSQNQADAAKLGSNALGVGEQDSRSGNSLVLGNPHFPWRGIDRFWELHVQIPGEINVIGASLMGFPAVNIGHNRHVAWSHTVSTAQRFTLFELELDPSDPTSYIYDGESIPMTSRTVEVPVGGGEKESTTLWYSRFGPVLARPSVGLSWTDTTVFALGDANDHIRGADTWLHMNKAKSAKDLVKAQSKYQGDPWVNTIGADDKGRAFYADNSVVPNVTAEKIDTCIKPGISTVIHNAAGIIPLDGSTSACNWGNDPDAAVKGIFGASNLPIQFRGDYVLNANDSYWQSNADEPLTGFSPIIGCEDCEQGLRTRLGHQMVQERMAATDGLGDEPGFTLKNMTKMWLADRSLAAELTSDSLAQVCTDNPTIATPSGNVDVTEACPILAAYNDTGLLDSPGGWLFNIWWQEAGGGTFWSTPFDVNEPLTTPNTLNQTNPATIEALGVAVQELRDQGIPLDASYGDVQFSPARNGKPIPIHGCNTGCWQAIAANADPDSDSYEYGQVGTGSSTVQMTEFKPQGPKAHWILTYSQSENEKSKHYDDQTKLFSKSEFVPMLYANKEIRGDPNLKIRKLKEKSKKGKGKGGKGK
ncbi:MAG TPA: penicillin acylase family protein [Solirubrobacterales bacterium]|nr:penicillin acylase family protein [Solirubrobacterales bacterium]